MSIVGEAALGALFEVVFQKLLSQEFLNFARQHHVATEISKWEKMLRTLRAVLEDAEQKQLTNPPVKDWLEDLRDLAYDVEDILDEFNYEILRREVKAKNQSSTSIVGKLTPDFISDYTPRALLFNSKMASKLKTITTRLQEITNRKSQLNLLENVGVGAARKVWSRPPSSSVPKEPVIYGRDEEKTKIIQYLLRHEQGDGRVGVIPIVGMGGLGKTTLARLVYNDDSVKESFEVRVWVCVSQDYEVKRITRGILEAVTSQVCGFEELSLVQAKLHEALQGKKFLLVLDDLWNENYGDWDVLRSPLMHGASGSKLIVTTRLAEVADMIKTVKYETLRHMSDDECWSIFYSHTFDWNRNSATNFKLEEIGRKIAKKCCGLPIAAMTLGGLLRSKEREEDWEAILNSKSWSFKDGKVDILSVLRMSYYDLPSYLKRCFAYCALFPEDFEFEENALVFLWMAEGLIPQKQMEEDEKQMEDLGHDYFHDLVSRSIFLPSNSFRWSQNKTRYVMHDLIHNIAKEVAGRTCYKVENDIGPPKQAIIGGARHSTFNNESNKVFKLLKKMEVLRTILHLPSEQRYVNSTTQNAIAALLSKLRHLRVLSFNGCRITELPKSIGNLKHLRYLDLSSTRINCLPKSTTTLYNLQILLLRNCWCLKKLPSDMGNLINLWNLDISGTHLNELPSRINELKNLGRLSDFVVRKGKGLATASLTDFKLLRGTLRISRLDNMTSTKVARLAPLSDKTNLDVLSLSWSHGRPRDALDEGVLEELRPQKNLKELFVYSYGGASFPSWMVEFPLLQEIKIVGCRWLSGCLSLLMPSLKKIEVGDCPLLVVSLPRLPALSELVIRGCKEVDCAENFDIGLLNELSLEHVESFTSLFKDKFMEGIKHAKSIILHDYINQLTSWKQRGMPHWTIKCCPQVCSLIVDEKEQIQNALAQAKVESLTLLGFQNLERLPQWVCNAMSLECLHVSKLPSLTMLSHIGSFPPLLKHFQIMECGELKCISTGGKLPIGLEELLVANCSKLEVIIERFSNDMMSLKRLCINGCPNLEFPSGLPTSLNRLQISETNILKLIREWRLHNLTSLESLTVIDCQGLDSILEEGLPTTLKYLDISNTNIMKPLLEWGLHNLTTLESLKVSDCEGLDSIPEGLPTTLKSLDISKTNIMKPLLEWGLHKLPYLESLYIEGFLDAVTFPPEDRGLRLPQSLAYLSIDDFPELRYISTKGLQALGSLAYLKISDCPKLASFPMDGLPPTLKELRFNRCPLLKQSRLKRQLSNISHIRCVFFIDGNPLI